MHIDCLGRIVRGTRKDENPNTDENHDWKIVFTNPNPSNVEEEGAYQEHNHRTKLDHVFGSESSKKILF